MSGLDDTSWTTRTVAATTTLTNNDYLLFVIGATGAVTVNLPAVASVQPGRSYVVLKDAATQTITIDGAGSETINGATTTTLANDAAYHAKTLISDGTQWFITTAY